MSKAILVLCFLLISIPAWGQEKVKIGFVDIQKAITESQAGKRAKERFQAQVKKVESDLMKEKQEVERMKSDFDKKGALLKEEEKVNLEKELQRKALGYQRSMQDSQEELRQKENEMTGAILQDLQKIVVEIGKKEKFTLILERSQVLYSDQGVDITPKVIELYNGRGPGKATTGK